MHLSKVSKGRGLIAPAFSLSRIFLIINIDFPLRADVLYHAVCTA